MRPSRPSATCFGCEDTNSHEAPSLLTFSHSLEPPSCISGSAVGSVWWAMPTKRRRRRDTADPGSCAHPHGSRKGSPGEKPRGNFGTAQCLSLLESCLDLAGLDADGDCFRADAEHAGNLERDQSVAARQPAAD